MKRRDFLGFLGGAAAAGPSAVSHVAESESKLSLKGLSYPKPSTPIKNFTLGTWVTDDRSKKDRAIDNLKSEFENISPEVLRRKRRNHSISALDPNIASLRSVSLTNKIRMTRDYDFEVSRERRRNDLLGIINEWWEY